MTAKCAKKVELVAYEDLGPEAIRKITMENMPLIVVNDASGNDLYQVAQNKWHVNMLIINGFVFCMEEKY